jgi:hypothetical protein
MATFEERMEALTRNLELMEVEFREFTAIVIPALHSMAETAQHLLLIAQAHEKRIERLEGE